jgi:hypothetical protein
MRHEDASAPEEGIPKVPSGWRGMTKKPETATSIFSASRTTNIIQNSEISVDGQRFVFNSKQWRNLKNPPASAGLFYSEGRALDRLD